MKNSYKYDVTALGEVLIDFAPVNSDEEYPVMAAKPGGAPANFLSALTKYGCKTAFIGKVGNDKFGSLLTKTLEASGIDTDGVIVDDEKFTTLAFVTLDENGDREFSFARKPGADTCIAWDEVKCEIIENSRVFHFGTLSLTDEPARTALVRSVEYAKKCGCLITFDPNLRKPLWRSLESAKKAILWGLGEADVVKISDDEVEFVFGVGVSYEEAAEKLLSEFNISFAMITMGAKGAYIANKNGGVFVPTPPADTIDTTGAGDIFGGSAVSEIIRSGKDPSDITKDGLYKIAVFASSAASLSTEISGGIPSIPSREKILEYIERCGL